MVEYLRADHQPPGSVCTYCAMGRHIYVHPNAERDTGWRLEDGCPCCVTHVSDAQWYDGIAHRCGRPPLGVATDHVHYADIPQEAREGLDETYQPDGVEMWWNSRNRTLSGWRPRDLWEMPGLGQQHVLAAIESMTAQIAT